MRNNDNVDKDEQSLVNDGPLQIIARGEVPQDSAYQLLDLVIRGLPEQTN